MRIIHFPIEPLVERYSADWLRWFRDGFNNAGLDYVTLLPLPLSNKIKNGSFLDVCGTNHFKAMQVAEFSEMAYRGDIHNDDVIFLMDAWFPGLESIAYIRDALKLKFKIMGIFHAGTYDPFDFLTKAGMQYWGKSLEESWFRILDKVFVATEFHKKLIASTRDIDPRKIIVTGIPGVLNHKSETGLLAQKENIVVFPHRLDSEKHPELFDALKHEVDTYVPHHRWEFIKTKDVVHSKSEYYDLLERARISVSFADQETFGIAMVESVVAGCLPIVPARLSYIELYDPVFTYSSFNEAVSLCRFMMKMPTDWEDSMIRNRRTLLNLSGRSIPNMIKEMTE